MTATNERSSEAGPQRRTEPPADRWAPRWIDLYIALLGVAAGFGVVIALAADAPVYVPIALAALAVGGVVGGLLAHRMIARATRPMVLVGPRGRGEVRSLRWALEDEWFDVQGCQGPDARPCPVLQGEPCPIHGHPAGVVIFHGHDSRAPIPPCEAALAAPALVVEEAGTALPDRRTVRWTGDAADAVEALESLIDDRRATIVG
jgi:hypothetical protein